MSTAEAVDPETPVEPEPGDPDETTPEPEPEPETPVVDDDPDQDEGAAQRDQIAVAAEMDKKLEKEAKLHEKRLGDIYGDQWEHRVMCPLCIGEGFMLPYGPGELPAEQLEAMDALSGRYTPPEYVEDSKYTMCEHCAGQGRTITGSKNPEHVTKLCDDCGGNGFKAKLYVPTPIATLPAPGSPEALNAGTPPNYGGTGPADQWGRPAGHVHYGIEPQFVTA